MAWLSGGKPDLSDHDNALDRFMQVTRQNNLHLGIDKIRYHKDQVESFGTTYKTEGHKPTNNKIKAIREMHQPTNVRELQCFLGMCNFLFKLGSQALWSLSSIKNGITFSPSACLTNFLLWGVLFGLSPFDVVVVVAVSYYNIMESTI